MKKKTLLGDAIRIGSRGMKKCYGKYFDPVNKKACCSVGAAAIALGVRGDSYWCVSEIDDLLNIRYDRICLVCGSPVGSAINLAVHLNETHRHLSFRQIAAIIDEVYA